MKIGARSILYYYPNYPENVHTNYEKMHADGFDCADFQQLTRTNGPLYAMDEADFTAALSEEKALAKANGMRIHQVHGPWPVDDTDAGKRLETMSYMKKAVRGTQLLDSQFMVVHPVMPEGRGEETDWAKVLAVNTAYFTELCAYAKAYDVIICLENMPFKGHALSTPAQIYAFVKQMHLENFKMCLDTGHAYIFGDQAGDMLRLYKDEIVVLHVHDNNGKEDSHCMPYSRFCGIDWEDFRNALVDIRFRGVVSTEVKINEKAPTFVVENQRKLHAQITNYLAGNPIS